MSGRKGWRAPFTNPVGAALRDAALRPRMVPSRRRAAGPRKEKHRKKDAGEWR